MRCRLGFALFVHPLGLQRRLDRHRLDGAEKLGAIAASTREPPKVKQRAAPEHLVRSQR